MSCPTTGVSSGMTLMHYAVRTLADQAPDVLALLWVLPTLRDIAPCLGGLS